MTAGPLTLDRVATPLGALLVLTDPDGALCALEFADREDRLHRLARRHHRDAVIVEGRTPEPVRRAIDAYFAGDPGPLHALPTRTGGTDFQRRVWDALRAIPAGGRKTYGEVARDLGHPTAVRAVGGANGANPICLAVPCHRVTATGGGLGGYAGGIERKSWLLAHEAGFTSARPASV